MQNTFIILSNQDETIFSKLPRDFFGLANFDKRHQLHYEKSSLIGIKQDNKYVFA
jgi:hypothetical protein